jgi:SAM-dependent methyltransferase
MQADITRIFDKDLRRIRRRRASARLESFRFLIDWCDAQLAQRLEDIRRSFDHAALIGGRSKPGPFLQSGKIGSLTVMDCAVLPDRVLDSPCSGIIADEEFLPFAPGSLDAVLSSFHLHCVNDLPGALLQIRKALRPDGLFIAAIPGGETLYELRDVLMQTELRLKGGVSPRVFPFADKQQMGALMQRAGFALPVIDSEIVTITYESMFELMRDLRGMGESTIIAERERRNPGKEFFMQAAQDYAARYPDRHDPGRIQASFEIIFALGWAPHESQQKPLRPGSATARLADALGTHEQPAGEKP